MRKDKRRNDVRSRRRTVRKTQKDRSNRDRRNRNRRNRKSMRGGLLMNPAPLDYSLADSWSSKASLNQGDDFFKYHREQHGGNVLVGAPFPEQVTNSTLPADMYASAHQSGIMRANQAIIGLNDSEGTPPIVPSQSGGPANTTGGSHGSRVRRGTRRARRDRRRKQSRRNRRRSMRGGSDHLGYSSVKAPTMLLPNRESYSAAALNPEYVSIKGYAEGISAEARDKVGFV